MEDKNTNYDSLNNTQNNQQIYPQIYPPSASDPHIIEINRHQDILNYIIQITEDEEKKIVML